MTVGGDWPRKFSGQYRGAMRKAGRAHVPVSERGAAAVEFAIVCSLLFLVVFGIIEFSMLLYDKAVITNASREGARAGIVYDSDRNTGSVTKAATDAANQSCTGSLISFGASQAPVVTVNAGGANSGDPLTVTVSYRYTFLVFPNLSRLFGGSFGSSLNLSSQTIMRME